MKYYKITGSIDTAKIINTVFDHSSFVEGMKPDDTLYIIKSKYFNKSWLS